MERETEKREKKTRRTNMKERRANLENEITRVGRILIRLIKKRDNRALSNEKSTTIQDLVNRNRVSITRLLDALALLVLSGRS